MKCPYCQHRKSFPKFLATVGNPFRIQCDSCQKRFSCGTLGRAILVTAPLIILVALFLPSSLWSKFSEVRKFDMWLVVLIALPVGIIIEYIVWAFDKPKASISKTSASPKNQSES